MNSIKSKKHLPDKLSQVISNQPQSLVVVMADSQQRQTVFNSLFDALKQSNTVIPVKADKNSISIDTVRQLLKTALQKRTADKLYILIAEANLLRAEAQTTLLKTLEEPPAGVHFILGVNHGDNLLATVRSRSVEVDLEADNETTEKSLIDSSRQTAYAKAFIMATPYERLKAASSLTSEKDKLVQFIDILSATLSVAINSKASVNEDVRPLIKRQMIVLDSADKLEANVSPKAIFAYLCTAI